MFAFRFVVQGGMLTGLLPDPRHRLEAFAAPQFEMSRLATVWRRAARLRTDLRTLRKRLTLAHDAGFVISAVLSVNPLLDRIEDGSRVSRSVPICSPPAPQVKFKFRCSAANDFVVIAKACGKLIATGCDLQGSTSYLERGCQLRLCRVQLV